MAMLIWTFITGAFYDLQQLLIQEVMPSQGVSSTIFDSIAADSPSVQALSPVEE